VSLLGVESEASDESIMTSRKDIARRLALAASAAGAGALATAAFFLLAWPSLGL